GEVFGFLGPNGAGKTTSIKMLLSLVTPTSGTGSLLDRPIGDQHIRGKIGYLPEHFRFHTWLKAWEFLDFHGKMFRMEKSRRQEVIPELLELVGLKESTHAKLGTFSKGMTQRIGLAQALMNDPKLVFLDEPTSGLDPLGRKLVRDIIDGLRNEGTAVFLNSHLLSEIEQTCDRVAFIRKGIVLETNSMATLNQERLRVVLRVARPTLELAHALDNLGDCINLDNHKPFDAETGHIVIHVDAEDNIAMVARYLVDQHHSIYELKPQRITLEERFLQVIQGEEA
ncbi:MAG: ABC transporter ATP-binding protein, partial [Chloroflexota bacterium]